MRNIIVIRCEHHRNDWLVGNVKRLELLRWLRIGEVDALQLLEFPVGADPLVMHEIDVQQAFGKVTWRAQRLLAVRAVIGVFVEFLENREHPFTIIEEDLLLHNEHIATEKVIADLKSGQNIAIITDAGTPGISDPGYLLGKACADEDLEMICLPGATAFVPALVVSGLPNHDFYFAGFLPQKKGRQTKLKQLAEEKKNHRFIRKST